MSTINISCQGKNSYPGNDKDILSKDYFMSSTHIKQKYKDIILYSYEVVCVGCNEYGTRNHKSADSINLNCTFLYVTCTNHRLRNLDWKIKISYRSTLKSNGGALFLTHDG